MKALMNKFATSDELNNEFVKQISQKLTQAIEERGTASILVSGGNTPKPLFAQLSEADIDWKNVQIALVDDRWVDADHESSNENTVRNILLNNKAADAQFIGMKTEHTDAFDAVEQVNKNMAELVTPFDVVILGMGEDGHTASIFPCCAQLEQGLNTDELILATEPTTAPFQRMTFSKSALLNSKQLYLHLVGENKEAVLNQVLAKNDQLLAPINAFLNQSDVPMTVMLATKK